MNVVVVGGGIAGTVCSIYLARRGVSVLLIDRGSQIGGLATMGLVNPFMKHGDDNGSCIKGIFLEILAELNGMGGIIRNCFDAQLLRILLYRMLQDAHVRVLLNTQVFDARVSGKKVISVFTSHAVGYRQTISGDFFVDATGDGVLSFLSGAHSHCGDPQGLNQATTTMFTMGGVSFDRVRDQVRAQPDNYFHWVNPDQAILSVAGYFREIEHASAEGFILPQDYLFFVELPGTGRVTVNTTHYGIKTTDIWAISEATMITNLQAYEILRFVNQQVSGFEKAYLENLAPMLGVRDSRRIMGFDCFTGDDVVHNAHHPQGVLRGVYGIDVHRKNPGTTEEERTTIPQYQGYYEIPLGSMIVQGFENLAVIGRCFSSDFFGQSAARIMPTCAGMGEAAGTAIYLALKQSFALPDIHGSAVRKEMGWYPDS